MSSIMKGLVTEKKKKPKPTSPEKWASAKAKARSKFDVYPSAYANAWAAKEYKKMGGGWRMGESIVDLDENLLNTYADMFNIDEEITEGENVSVIYIDDKPSAKYVSKFEAEKDASRMKTKFPNKKIEIKQEVREAPGDTLMDPEVALSQARRITKAIKYDDTVGEIITQLQMLAERTEGVDSKTLEYSIDGVLAAKNALESAVYDLEEAFEDAARNQQYKRDEEELGEDYTGEFAAEKTPAINPYGGLKDRQHRGAISETPTDNPTGASGEGGWRKYKPKSAGEIDEGQIYSTGGGAGQSYRKFTPKSAGTFKDVGEAVGDFTVKTISPADSWKKHTDPKKSKSEVPVDPKTGKTLYQKVQGIDEDEIDEACWSGYKQVGGKMKGGKMVPNCVPKESAIMKGLKK